MRVATCPLRACLDALLILVILVANSLPAHSSASQATSWKDKVDPWVLETASSQETEFLVFLSEQADLSQAAHLESKAEKDTYVFQKLVDTARRTQAPVLEALAQRGIPYRSYWVANMLWVRAGLPEIQALAQRSDVAHLYANPQVHIQEPVEQMTSLACPDPQPQPEWNIVLVGAPQVWKLGYTGQGVVVGGADTGFEWAHPALKNHYRGWDGQSVNHDYNWFDATSSPSPTPIDPYGHGTHTMGIMVGDDGKGVQVGMAPGAEWIGCRNMDTAGNGSPATYATCYQWFIAPWPVGGDAFQGDPSKAADVINNSWGCPRSEGCTDPNVLLTVVESVRAAGILTTQSAGNSGGGGCATVDTPAAIYDASFTVGATNAQDALASYSSRGPVTVDGSRRLKPDISAPGMSVCSSVPGGGYALKGGTSMAAPHVAGLAALLISAQPALDGQVDQLETLIEQTALHISSNSCSSSGVPNNLYGWGRIQAMEAARRLPHSLEIVKTASSQYITPGQEITYTLTISHLHTVSETTNVLVTDTLPAGTTFITATLPYSLSGNTVRWSYPALGLTETISMQLVVQTPVTSTCMITNQFYAAHSDDVGWQTGPPVYVFIGHINFLPVVSKNP